MIIIVAGMQRSGSTFSFNIARELMAVRGGAEVLTTNFLEEVLRSAPRAKNVIVKTHSPDDKMNRLIARSEAPCICTIRKPEDAIASWMKVFGFSIEESIQSYREWLSWHQSMKNNMLNIRYELIERRPLFAVMKIRRYLVGGYGFLESFNLSRKYSKRAVFELSRKIEKNSEGVVDVGFSFYDPNTFFHRGHVSGLQPAAASQFLSEKEISHIRSSLREFLSPSGDYVW